jgi:Tol biopolymer transport system component
MPTTTCVWYSCRAMAVRRLSIRSATVVAVAAAAIAASAPAGAVTPPRWIVSSGHPDGSGLAQLFRVGIDGSGLKEITTGKLPATAPSFSPDGKQIVFTRLGSGIFRVSVDGTGLRRLARISTGPPDCGEGRCPQYALYRSDVSGKGRRRVANDTGPAGWSPDGRRLVFLLQGAPTLFDVASGTRTKLDTGPHTAAGDAPPAWQPR